MPFTLSNPGNFLCYYHWWGEKIVCLSRYLNGPISWIYAATCLIFSTCCDRMFLAAIRYEFLFRNIFWRIIMMTFTKTFMWYATIVVLDIQLLWMIRWLPAVLWLKSARKWCDSSPTFSGSNPELALPWHSTWYVHKCGLGISPSVCKA